jgi:hypothetical protein
MDAFSHLSVLISIVIGLAITQILQGYRTLLIARRRVRVFAPTLIWGGLLLVLNVQMWWTMYGFRTRAEWTFIQFTVVLLQTVLTYMLAALVLPDVGSEEQVDLEAHYLNQAPWFFGIGVVLLIVSVTKDLVLDGVWPSRTNLAFHVLFTALWTTAAFVRRRSYHRVLAWVMSVALVAYVWLLFARL